MSERGIIGQVLVVAQQANAVAATLPQLAAWGAGTVERDRRIKHLSSQQPAFLLLSLRPGRFVRFDLIRYQLTSAPKTVLLLSTVVSKRSITPCASITALAYLPPRGVAAMHAVFRQPPSVACVRRAVFYLLLAQTLIELLDQRSGSAIRYLPQGPGTL